MLLLDTGPVVAVGNARDAHHGACLELLEMAPPPLLLPELCLSEAAHLLARYVSPHAEARLAESLRDREIRLIATEPQDWKRISELVRQYLDLPLGIVDAAVVAIAERLSTPTIATLDRHHFSVVRPQHVESFDLVP